jgi:PAT family beta-lactamase induction signal transducer AmpG
LSSSHRAPSRWLFAVVAMPYGSFNGVVAIALPYLLRRHGTSVERIAGIEAIVQAPAIWYVLWAPAVDIALRRRTWIVLLSVATALCTVTALCLTPTTLRGATALFVVASVFNQPVSSALGALVASVVHNAERGRTAGWSQAGILGGGVVTGGLVVWLGDHTSTLIAALVAGALIGLPALAALLVHEPAPHVTQRRQQLRRMWRQFESTVRRRDVWLGFAFFLSPVSAGALMNLFSGVAPDFHASSDQVIAVAAIGGVMLTLGALIAGALLDRVSRWRMYAVIGLLTGASLAVIAAAPLRAPTYLIGAATYALCTGAGYAAFMALALELLGSDPAASGTLFALFMAASNVPIVYMLRLDGLGHRHFGVRGMLVADGAANAVFGVVLLMLLARVSTVIHVRHPRLEPSVLTQDLPPATR